MELTSSRTVPASVEKTWAALNDPETLKACIPGCESIERVSDTEFKVAMTARVGPVSAKFSGRILLSDIVPPTSYKMSFEGQGGAAGVHANLLRQLGDAVSAFYRDLAGRGHGGRVCVMTFSEFGRRAAENGSKGTDHGSGAPMFLVGGKVKAGVVGEHPSLTKLEDGNLAHAIDFRRVYAAVLDRWLGVDSKAVLGRAFEPAEVFAS